MQIYVSIQQPNCEEFARWLKTKGHDADVIIANESSIDGKNTRSSEELTDQFNELWESFYEDRLS